MKKMRLILGMMMVVLSVSSLFAQNYALSFDGTYDYVKVPADASLNIYNSSFTLEAWVRSSQVHSTEVIIFEYGTWEVGTYQMSSDQQDQIKVNFNGRSSADGAEATVDWTDGSWHHFAGVFDNTANELRLYMDGSLLVTVAETNAPGDATLPLYIGARGGTEKFSEMEIDEIRIWNDVRTLTEIQNNMNIELTGNESNLVAYYDMNEGTGTSLTDNSSNSNDGTLYNMDNTNWLANSPLSGTYSGGSGTSGDPFQIATKTDLIELRNTSADWGAYFIQTANIAFNADETQVDWNNDGSSGPAEGFAPIGNVDTPFTGEYDGGGYTIDNLYINRSATNIALFSKTDGATIANIGVTNVDITGNDSVGGLVGSNNHSTVNNSYSTGNVSGQGNSGGLVGYNYNCTVSNSYSTCSVSIDYFDMEYRAGGLVGTNIDNSTISNSYSTGSVSGSSDVGGLVGYNLSATISNSYSTGSVSGSSSGGLVGSNDGTVNNSFWNVETDGIAGNSSGDTDNGATGKTTAEMQDVATFTDVNTDGLISAWDFVTNPNDDSNTNDYWDIDQDGTVNNSYPILSWQDGADAFLEEPHYAGGNGTSEDPFKIATTDDLIELSHYSNHWAKYFIQTADIAFNADETQVDWDGDGTATWDTEDQKGFSPIGNSSTMFTGEYDGDGHTIDGLYISRSANYIGFFGWTKNGATVKNIGVTNVDITGGNNDIGGLVAYNYGSTITNSYSTGSVSARAIYIGGLVGLNYNSSPITNSYSTVSVSGEYYVGGLVGHNDGSTIANSYSTGSVSGIDYVGGLVGTSLNSTVSNCFWDTQTSGQASSDGGTGKTTAQMKDIATFTDVSTDGLSSAWDFETNPNDDTGDNDYWDMDNSQSINNGYPFLSWENGTDVALPVTLVSFSAEDLNGAVNVSWITESETENLAFRIYRDNEMIAELEGAGTTTEPQDYRFTDNHVIPGKTYTYVLADVTIGNKEVKHSDKAVTITVGEGNVGKDNSIGKSYPNPFNPICIVPLNLAVSVEVNAALYNINGRLINELHNGALSAGSHDLKIDGANLATGIYLVKIRINDALHIQKIALMK